MEDGGDEMAGLEAAICDAWSRSGVNARTGGKALDPRLDVTAGALVLCRRGGTRHSDLASDVYVDKSTVSRQIDADPPQGVVQRSPHDANEPVPDTRERLKALPTVRPERWRKVAGWPPGDIAGLTRPPAQPTRVDLR